MSQKSKIIAFDLDDVICTRPKKYEHLGVGKYEYCTPIKDIVKVVNDTYDSGYTVKIYTARGMSTFSNNVSKIYNELFEITKKQLDNWGVKYHELIMGKTHYDLLIDDKAINSTKIQSINDINNFVK